MKKEEVEKLLELIGKAVNNNSVGAWSSKRDVVLAEASDEDKNNLSEFCEWFERLGPTASASGCSGSGS